MKLSFYIYYEISKCQGYKIAVWKTNAEKPIPKESAEMYRNSIYLILYYLENYFIFEYNIHSEFDIYFYCPYIKHNYKKYSYIFFS